MIEEIPTETNGPVKRSDGHECPFYDLGRSDVHELVKQMTVQNKQIGQLIELVAGKSQVPMKIYIWSVVILTASITGAKFIGELFEHAHQVLGL